MRPTLRREPQLGRGLLAGGGGAREGSEEPRQDGGDLSPEEQAGPISRMLFLWSFGVAYRGYQRGRLDFEDLLRLPSNNRPMLLQQKFRTAWMKRIAGEHPGRRQVLLPALLEPSMGLLMTCYFFRALVIMFSFLQPVLLHTLLESLEKQSGGGSSGSQALPAALSLAFTVGAYWLCWEMYWFLNVRAAQNMQVLLVHFTYRKGLFLAASQEAAARYTHGQLQNLIATDATKPSDNFIADLFAGLANGVLSAVVACWNLCSLLGLSAGLMGSLVVAVFAPVSFLSNRLLKRYVRHIQESRDTRGKVLYEYLSAMKVVKCFCLEETAEAAISKARQIELRWQARRRLLYPVMDFLLNSCGLIGMAVAFTWFTLVSPRESLSAAQAFSSLAWMNILRSGLQVFPQQLASFADLMVSIHRLEVFFRVDTGSDWLRPLVSDSLTVPAAPPVIPHSGDVNLEVPRFVVKKCIAEYGTQQLQQQQQQPQQQQQQQQQEQPQQRQPFTVERIFGDGLSLEVPRGQLFLICGPVGCGKSTLLSVLSQTFKPVQGSCEVFGGPSPCALVTQRPWLENDTCRANVLFGTPEDPERLARTLEVCGLVPDLAALQCGLDTLVGEEGVQLSGGQRQRISLARAVYSRTDAVLLDDILSALDAHVSRHVWEEAICKELGNRTRVVVTHQVQYCQDPRVGLILVLGPGGSKEFFGSFADMRKVPRIMGMLGIDDGASQFVATKETETDKSPIAGSGAGSEVEARVASADSSVTAGHQIDSRRVGGIAKADMSFYVWSCGGPCALLLIAVPILVFYAAMLASNYQLARWTDMSHSASGDVARSQSEHLFLYLQLVFLTSVCQFSFTVAVQLGAYFSSRNLYLRFMQALLRAQLEFFDRTPVGQILNRCLKDVAQVDDRMGPAFLAMVQSVLDAVATALVLSAIAPWSLAGVPFFCVGYAYAMRIYRWPARDLKRMEAASRSPVMSYFSDSVRGAGTIRAYAHETRFLMKSLELVEVTSRATYTYWAVRTWNAQTLEFLGSLLLLVACFAISMEVQSGRLSPGLVGFALTYAIDMPRKLMWLSINGANLEAAFVSVERIAQYTQLPEESDSCTSPDSLRNQSPLLAVGLPVPTAAKPGHESGLALRDVWFRYSTTGPWILKGLTFNLAAGARAAVVGRTGCGKSSLISVSIRLYAISSGTISVQGSDICSMSLRHLRSRVRILLQDPILFSGTVRSNLLCMPDEVERLGEGELAALPSDHALSQVLELLGLADIIKSLGGLAGRVEEAGQNFSQGQKQLLCLARTLAELRLPSGGHLAGGAENLCMPKLILCDEPTSSCDLLMDATIHRTLLEVLPRSLTVVVVCHRLHRVRSFDTAIIMDAGQVLESGSPEELLREVDGTQQILRHMCIKQGVL